MLSASDINFTARLPGLRRNGGVGDEGEREEGERKKRENEANLRSPFWANPGAIVHFSTSSQT